MTRLVLVVSVLAAYAASGGGAAVPSMPDTLWQLGKDGLPAQLRANTPGAPPLLRAPLQVALTEQGQPLALPAAGLASEFRMGRALFPYLELSLRNTSARPRTVTAALSLRLARGASDVFFPASASAHEPLARDEKPRVYGYAYGGISTAMPLGQVYSRPRDWGLAFFQEFGLLVEAWRVTLTPGPEGVTVTIALPMSLPAGQSARRRVYFAATPGDWRPALGAVLAQFPQAFVPPHPQAVKLDGPFVCSGGTPPDKNLAAWREQGCKVVEIHATFPFYGDYIPGATPWTTLLDDTWHTLKTQLPPAERPADSDWRGIVAAVQKQHPPDMTADRVRDYIARLHAQGFKGLIYYNPTEAWAPWAEERFRDDVRRDASGQPVPTWYESSCMVPDLGRPWGQHMIAQLKGQLQAYPQLDGVFFDQSATGGHDLTLLCHEATKLVRARGGLCWWNGPYNMELAALADGMMDEGGGTGTYRPLTALIQYYGLAGKPCVSLGSPSPEAYAEMLAHGIQVPAVIGYESLGSRWRPLFRWMLGRQWVLDAHALAPVPGMAANIYRVAGGNVAVTLVPEDAWAGEPPTAHNLPVTVKLPEAAAIKAAYLLAPDWRGYHKLPLKRQGNTLQFAVPRVHWAGLVVLARTGVFPALEGPLHVVQGQAGSMRYVVDNWTAQPVAADLRLRSGAAEATLRAQVKPNGSAATVVALPAAPAAAKTVALDVTGKLSAGDLPPVAEVAVDPPVMVALTVPPRLRDDEIATATVSLLSHLPAGERLSVALTSTLVEVADPARARQLADLAPPADVPSRQEVKLKARRGGEGTVAVTVQRGADVVAHAEQPLQVVATALSPNGLQHLQAATLELEVFGSDGGTYAHKPVSVNGVVVGDLPTGFGDSWHAVALPLPEAAVKALAAQNAITIDNKVGDAFKVRNLRLVLTLRGGLQAVSQTDTGAYTGWVDWPYGEGKQFPAGEPLTGMRADLRLDPNRQEKYDWFFGTPQRGRLVVEVFGADTGQYAHKPVSVNECLLGDLPGAPNEWTEKSLALTPEALAKLQVNNTVRIENSQPADAFKVRKLRLEIMNIAGETWTTVLDEGSYTSCPWDFAEGKILSPIVSKLTFRAP